MKYHICCGDVYLKGYINIDIVGISRSAFPELPENYGTTLVNYYTKPLDLSAPRRKRNEQIIDFKLDITEIEWPIKSNSADEVVIIQALEHFTFLQCRHIIQEVYRILKPGGQFLFDFPDTIETIEEFKRGNMSWETAVRFIFGSHFDDLAIHKVGFTKVSFDDLLKKCGVWNKIEFKEVVVHDYPAIGGIAIK